MKHISTVAELRRAVAEARRSVGATGPGAGEERVSLVPTMGALHSGHLSLVGRAKQRAPFVVMSIFVNPTQFGPGEDFDAYPRTPAEDAAAAEAAGVDVLFAPSPGEVFPDGDTVVKVIPGKLAERLCGLSRPGHFQGVLTVVAKLFGMVQPDVAVFGQKDFQQSVLIRRMVKDLDIAVAIDVAPIVRESDGLALSSRNVYLTERQRERARSLSEGLLAARAAFRDEGVTDPDRLKARVRGTMRDADVEPEYIELVDPDTLDEVDEASAASVLAVAARVGDTRLIDNVILGHEE